MIVEREQKTLVNSAKYGYPWQSSLDDSPVLDRFSRESGLQERVMELLLCKQPHGQHRRRHYLNFAGGVHFLKRSVRSADRTEWIVTDRSMEALRLMKEHVEATARVAAVPPHTSVRPLWHDSAIILRLQPAINLTREQFFHFCQLNSNVRIELTADGEIVIMPPTGGETGARNMRLCAQVALWADEDGSGVAFDSSTGFVLPNSAMRSPDVAWVAKSRLARLSAEEMQRFPPLCPDFVIELCSPTDSISEVERKMEEYRDNGTRLGWLLDPSRRQATVYYDDGRVDRLERPDLISGHPVLPGFVASLDAIWAPLI